MTQKVIAICVQKKNLKSFNIYSAKILSIFFFIEIKPTQRTTTVNIWWRPN